MTIREERKLLKSFKTVGTDEMVYATSPANIQMNVLGNTGDISNQDIDNYLKVKDLAEKYKKIMASCQKAR